jgi:hypothetical protein
MLGSNKAQSQVKVAKIHAPDDRRLFNNASNKLKAAPHELQNASFAAYVSTLKRNNSIWKPLKSRKKPQTPLPQFVKTHHPRDPGTRAIRKKLSYSPST